MSKLFTAPSQFASPREVTVSAAARLGTSPQPLLRTHEYAPASDSRLGKLWLYDTNSGLAQIAQHDPGRFLSGAPNFLTVDEESSGIIDAANILGPGWFLLDVQAHYGIPGELVEGGQLLAMYVDPSITPEPSSFALLIVGVAFLRRRG